MYSTFLTCCHFEIEGHIGKPVLNVSPQNCFPYLKLFQKVVVEKLLILELLLIHPVEV